MDRVDRIGKGNEKLVVKSKLNPNTLVVESDVVGAKDSANIREVADERLVVKSKLNPNTLVVQSDIVGGKDSTKIGGVAAKNGTLYNKFNILHKCKSKLNLKIVFYESKIFFCFMKHCLVDRIANVRQMETVLTVVHVLENYVVVAAVIVE